MVLAVTQLVTSQAAGGRAGGGGAQSGTGRQTQRGRQEEERSKGQPGRGQPQPQHPPPPSGKQSQNGEAGQEHSSARGANGGKAGGGGQGEEGMRHRPAAAAASGMGAAGGSAAAGGGRERGETRGVDEHQHADLVKRLGQVSDQFLCMLPFEPSCCRVLPVAMRDSTQSLDVHARTHKKPKTQTHTRIYSVRWESCANLLRLTRSASRTVCRKTR